MQRYSAAGACDLKIGALSVCCGRRLEKAIDGAEARRKAYWAAVEGEE